MAVRSPEAQRFLDQFHPSDQSAVGHWFHRCARLWPPATPEEVCRRVTALLTNRVGADAKTDVTEVLQAIAQDPQLAQAYAAQALLALGIEAPSPSC